MTPEQQAARILELEAFILRLAERLAAASEVLGWLAERKARDTSADLLTGEGE
jgi:hypothetical protein